MTLSQNKHIYLLRHAKSSWSSSARTDHARPLNGRGFKDARRIGEWMQANGHSPESVICSTAERARQTLDGVMESLEIERLDYRDELYHASSSTIIALAMSALESVNSVLLVAHNPGMDDTLRTLVKEPLPYEGYKLMTTGNLAIISCDLDRGECTLEELIRPKSLS